jgi:large subunit ribosomal protein L18
MCQGKLYALVLLEKKKIITIEGSKKDIASLVGKTLAEKAVKLGVSKVSFDRAGYLYHGRVKSLADGAREGGLKF